MTKRVLRSLGGLAGITGAGLLLLMICGLFIDPGVPTASTRDSDIPGYHFVTRSADGLKSAVDQPQSEFDLVQINRLVFESMVHVDDRHFKIYENWIMWGVGLIYEPASRLRRAPLLAQGQAGFCREAVLVLNYIATLNGKQSRYIHLEGHVVSEVLTDQGWQVADPDFGLVFPMSLQGLQTPQGVRLLTDKLSQAGYGQAKVDEYVKALLTKDDNYVLPGNEPSSPRLYQLEVLSEWMVWLLPGLLLGLGLLLWRVR